LSWIAFHPDQVAKLRDTKGQTVLHHAALFRAPAHVMEGILWVAPELASVPNRDGELALHWAVRLTTPNPVLALLLQANPETAFWRDHQNSTPLSLLWGRHQTSLLQNWRSEREKLLVESNNTWKRILSIFRAVHEAQNLGSSENFLPLHIAASRPCPPCLFPLMVEVYKEQLSTEDIHGRLPLTIACTSPSANRSCDVLTKIELLLREYSPAAKYSNSSPVRYPLHIALASGIIWNEGIHMLLQAFPVALSIRDPVTGLFPFALAAMQENKSSVSPENTKETVDEDLTTIYCVLRADPSVLKLGR
jgi:hypothetical protein